MGFLDKITRKTTDKAADRISDKIVNKMFGKKEEETYSEAPQVQTQAVNEVETPAPAPAEMSAAEKQAIANAQAASAETIQSAMGMAYNTKKCPECQALCFNAPAQCPYCGADLKSVTPLTPEELEKIMDKQ